MKLIKSTRDDEGYTFLTIEFTWSELRQIDSFIVGAIESGMKLGNILGALEKHKELAHILEIDGHWTPAGDDEK